jgi:hypothetical protein
LLGSHFNTHAQRALVGCGAAVWRAVHRGEWEVAASLALQRDTLLTMFPNPPTLLTKDSVSLPKAIQEALTKAMRGTTINGQEAVSAVRALAMLTGKVEDNGALTWLEARTHVVSQSGSFSEAAASLDHAVEVAKHMGASADEIDGFLRQCQAIATKSHWGLSSVSHAATLLNSLSAMARSSLAVPMQRALDEAVIADLNSRLLECVSPSQAEVALAQWRANCGSSATLQLSAGPLQALAMKWAQPALKSWVCWYFFFFLNSF